MLKSGLVFNEGGKKRQGGWGACSLARGFIYWNFKINYIKEETSQDLNNVGFGIYLSSKQLCSLRVFTNLILRVWLCSFYTSFYIMEVPIDHETSCSSLGELVDSRAEAGRKYKMSCSILGAFKKRGERRGGRGKKRNIIQRAKDTT